jgi:hypothetical protein
LACSQRRLRAASRCGQRYRRGDANLSAQLRADATALDHALVELDDLRKAKRDLEERMQWVERRAEVYALGQEFAQTLNERLRQLPRPERLAVSSEQRAKLMSEASDADLRVEHALSELRDLDAATAQRLAAAQPPISQEQKAQLEHAVRAALAEQRDVLERLTTIERKRVDLLHETEEAWRDLERLAQAARAKLIRFLFWIQAAEHKDGWRVRPAHMVGIANQLEKSASNPRELARSTFWPVLVLVAATTPPCTWAIVACARIAFAHRRDLQALSLVTPSRRSRSLSRSRCPSPCCFGPRARHSHTRPTVHHSL